MSTPVVVPVGTAYDVLIGHGVSSRVPDLVPSGAARALLIRSPHVVAVADAVAAGLRTAGLQVVEAEVPDAEAAKTVEVAAGLWSLLGQEEFTRTDLVVGVGGGATTDLAGFVGASWLRGVPVLLVPTTMLGMVDAAVGGKTGINTAEGKNLVGAFHPPVGVLADLDTLRTLPGADLRAGLAEVVKCGFIADPGILDLVESNPRAALDLGDDLPAELVRRAVAVKADVVTADLRESSLREVLNYGHTFAHAVEQAESYRWRHGDAVAVGMVYVAELAARAGVMPTPLVARHRDLLQSLGLPVGYDGADFDALHTAMRRDKKTRGSLLRFVVLEDLARPTRLEGPDDALLRAAWEAVR